MINVALTSDQLTEAEAKSALKQLVMMDEATVEQLTEANVKEILQQLRNPNVVAI